MRRRWLIALVGLAVITPATAENLLVDQVRASEEAGAVEIQRGRTMDQVKETRGEPDSIRGPVGEPPITRWVYDKFTVYFENDRVIHAVAQR